MDVPESLILQDEEQVAPSPDLAENLMTGPTWHEEEGRTDGREEELEEETASGGASPKKVAEDTGFPFHRESHKENAQANKPTKKMSLKDRVCTLHLRRNLSQLDKMHEEKELLIQKTREELNTCRKRIVMLIQQQETVEAEIQAEKEANNTAAVFRLQATLRRLGTELRNEKDLELETARLLKEHEYNMWHVAIEEGRFASLRQALEKEEEELERQRIEQVAERLRKEKAAFSKAKRKEQIRKKKEAEAQLDYELQHRKIVQDAQLNHKKAVQFLRATLTRIRKKEKKEELKSREHMKKRMEAVLTLKRNLTANREILRSLQAREKAKVQEAKQQEQNLKEAILAQGGDVTKHLFHHKRLVELEKQKQAFEEEQKTRKCEIVARLLQEEAQGEKLKAKQLGFSARKVPEKIKIHSSVRAKTLGFLEILPNEPTATAAPALQPTKDLHFPSVPPCKNWPGLEGAVSFESVQAEDVHVDTDTEEETLAEPEILGLWAEEYKPYKVPKDEVDRKPVGGTQMDKDILAHTLEKLRAGIIRKQVVSGHEFKGCPFYSKPDLIHFKDFDVGKTYKKKMTLINASFSVNYCKLVGVGEHLKDFIDIHLDPPGSMSAGMSCKVVVTFKPMINKDLEGDINFLAQTGAFSIPLKCTTKKCVLALDKELIDFGTHVVGETISRTITLMNQGALGTRFRLLTSPGVSGSHLTAAKSSTGTTESSYFFEDEKFEKAEKNFSNVEGRQVEPNPHSSPEVIQNLPPTENQGTKGQEPSPGGEPVRQGEATASEEIAPTLVELPPEEEPPEIRLGEVTEGTIGSFGSIKLPVVFTPMLPGSVTANFMVAFDNPDCPSLHFRANGVSIDVPVWAPNPSINLKICMYDRLYQDSIIIQSRAKAALRLKFEVCKELRNHMELLPQSGYIQAQASYTVQLKFLPRHSLPEDAGKYFDKDTRVLEAPVTISVADQIKPVNFIVQAIVTSSDLELHPALVDFGYCTIYEAVRARISLVNKAILPQEFGFVGIPEVVEIQPNDGFGTLLPLETLHLDVIFNANKAKEYSFDLVCKTEINRQFKLPCRAIGVHPPLELSHSLVKFPATALNDVSSVILYVVNSHLSMNHLTHCVPRIGNGEPVPVGPTSFEFLPPEGAPITIVPSVGTVWPGKASVHPSEGSFPTSPFPVRSQFAKDLTMPVKKEMRKQSTNQIIKQSTREKLIKAPVTVSFEPPKPEDIKPSSDAYTSAQASLTRHFCGKLEKYTIPCIVATGDIKEKEAKPLNYSPYNTLYLELHCPAVAPPMVVTSDNGKRIFDFGEVAIGHKGIKRITVQNICQEQLTIEFSILNPNGPFIFLNPTRALRPGETRVFVISFSPRESTQFFETLDITSQKGTLTLSILGTGVAPTITCSIEGNVLNMGYVMARETSISTFKLQNSSSLPIKYSMKLESLSIMRNKDPEQLPIFITSQTQRTSTVGTQNHSGLSVFSVIPVEGVIESGKSQEFTVTFSPDHESLYYSDELQVVLFDREVACVLNLKGAAREHMMFVEGGDPLDVPVESLAGIPASGEESLEEVGECPRPILLSLDYIQSGASEAPATRELQVGCIRTSQPASKKTVEFSLDSLPLLQQSGFTIDPTKGTVDRGQTRSITVTWLPPAGFDPHHPLTVKALLTLRGDVKETYRILFVGRVVSE
ncbi:cilia- and flagella-associated protein 74 isoform X3 [Ornithorhynchus anatinus]|uniref:cilia- and flagella-associated protein 74 isoform X3 n=1 Tax=Ornithorhynchus anatinus TaxID=9258 RepID=UPI0010A93B76|nr:cilia- and flagella-associated protein 74 isoform X3 [Ornithorhynchus anatinus]